MFVFFFFQAEDGIRDYKVTGVQTCALPILPGTLGTGGSVPAPGANDRGPGVLRAGPPPHTAGPGAAVSPATGWGGIGRAAGRERGEISGGAGSLKKKKRKAISRSTTPWHNR